MASGNFIPQAIDIVKQAIDADQKGEYETALGLYKKSLGKQALSYPPTHATQSVQQFMQTTLFSLSHLPTDYFMAGLKYEKNPATKATITARVDGYMKRAEDLKVVVEREREAAANKGKKGKRAVGGLGRGDEGGLNGLLDSMGGCAPFWSSVHPFRVSSFSSTHPPTHLYIGGGGGTMAKQPGEEDKTDDEEKNKLKGALASSIVTEKPNVKWDDVAGTSHPTHPSTHP